MKKKIRKTQAGLKLIRSDTDLLSNITQLIERSRQRVAVVVNAELMTLNWNIGKLIQENILENKRAGYGEQIVQKLSDQLREQYGSGWGEKQLRHCLRAAETFSEKQILYAVRRQLSWTHLRTIAYLNDELRREFYLQMCINERWSTRLLQDRIDSMLFERTAISKKPATLIKNELAALKEEDKLSPDLVFRDPYFFNFLGLKDTYSEKDLESAILAELQRFIIELGSDFAFIARQKRITIDGDDYSIDLLFYHRKLRRLVVIDLKLGKFKAADKGQMELYLRWLQKHEMREGEDEPLGLILCASKSDEQIELLELEHSRIHVAQYLTELPSKKLLLQKLHQAIQMARSQFPERTKT